jgi:hypothetical protein
MQMSQAKKVRSWNPFKKLRSRSKKQAAAPDKNLGFEHDFDLGSEISSVHSDVNSSVYSKATQTTLAFSELDLTPGSSSPRVYDHTLDRDTVGFREEALAQVKRVLDLKENDTQSIHHGTCDTYESEAGMEAVFVQISLDDRSTHADDDDADDDDHADDEDEEEEIRDESTNDGEQIGRQISHLTTEVLDRMTVIECRAGQVEDSEGMVMPTLVHTRSQESDVNDAEAKKVVDRRGPRGQIQYSEDETIKIESGLFDTTVKDYISSKKNHRGKSLVERESDDLKFERCGTGGQICYLDEDDDAEDSSSSEDTDSDSSASSVAELLSSSFVDETEQNSTVNYEDKGGSCCFMYNDP